MATSKKAAPKKAPAKKAAVKKAAANKAAKKTATIAKSVAKPAKSKETKVTKPVKAAAKKQGTKAKPVAKATPKKAVSKTPAKTLPKVKTKAPAKAAVPAKKVVAVNYKKVAPKKPQPVEMAKQTKTTKKVKAEEIKPVRKVVPKNIKDIKVIPAKPVVLPKIKTKTSRPFEPDFTRSILDQPATSHAEPIVRYSDAELMEFRELINRKLESAKKEWNYLQGLISRKDETGGDESENRYMTMEDGSLSMEREQLSQMASRQVSFIDHLEKAIMRIENKTYGICRETGKLIDKARLRAVPHATLSIEAKMSKQR